MADLFAGNWYGTINGTPSTLTLSPARPQITGKVDAGGYLYSLALTEGADGAAQGTLRDDKLGASVSAALTPAEGGLALTFTLPGQKPTIIPFNRTAPKPNDNLDPRLIGHWLNSESHVSGSFSSVVEISITFLADGRALEFEGRVIGSGHDTGPGQGTTTYYWAADGRQLFFGQAPGQYEHASNYVIEGNSLLVTQGDGKRDVWQRLA